VGGVDPRLRTPAWRRLRLAVLDRDLGLCQIRDEGCTRYATCVDHIVARVDGGDMWNPANLRAACRSCNTRGSINLKRRTGWRYRWGVADYETRF
jgi:5-methylcytosine-specific restriction endonuclease McrA